MILLWGLPNDGPLRAVYSVLHAHHEPVYLLDQHEFATTMLELYVGSTTYGTLHLEGLVVALEAITSVYARPYDVRRLPQMRDAGPQTAVWQHGEALDDALQAWVEVTPAFVVSRPSAMASNGSKPFQSALIRAAGLDIPETLVTTDAKAAMAFHEMHQTVVYKSTSGIRSIVSRLGPEHLDRLADIGNCPTQFQEYIAGRDIRVHVVGDSVFGAEILSAADDYRYAGRTGHSVDIRACELERELADRCRKLAAELCLPVAGIDLRRTPEGRYYCFEVNPSPGFTFYQQATGQPIAEAIAYLLADSPSTG